MGLQIIVGVVVLVAILIAVSLRVLPEYERGVMFTLGRMTGVKGPGLFFVVPVLQRMFKIDTRVSVMDVPPQDVISRDNVSVKVNAVVYFRVIESDKAVVEVADYRDAVSQLAQTTLRSVLGQHELDEMLASREKLNTDIQEILDQHTDPWGIKVANVEIKQVDLEENITKAIARQAEAERARRAKVINSEGERQAAENLSLAAQQLSTEPQAIQLRYMQTLVDIAGDNNSTIVFPLPMDLIEPLMDLTRNGNSASVDTSANDDDQPDS
ncbi:slipin family protein [Salinisphaera sp. USBA-960]|uniref:slipin family protein n=1 Tax=Salinisphaera orenii TaxID=856731 RepID=UPI000DBE6F78|nr:slipin family protein [Salifodinibacter halophilus]NNC25879.1 slipin family protein [Salifodinibacter halophilus]